MDRTSRVGDAFAAVQAVAKQTRTDIWTAIPAILQSYDKDKGTCTAQPSIKGQQQSKEGKWTDVTMPLCLDCPVQFPSGGKYVMTFPLEEGDEGLLVFASRCIDSWWQSGGIQSQLELRMHDLSDGFFIPGVRSQPRKLENVKADAVQIRSVDGETYVEIGPGAADGTMKVRTQADEIVAHARKSWSWDVAGFGESWTWLGGTAWEHKTWQKGATIVQVILPIKPPEGP